jgi:hypothetical protein
MRLILEGAGNLPDYGEVDTGLYSDLSDADIVLRREDDGDLATSFSANISFYGSARDYLMRHLVDSPNFRENGIILKVYDDCCKPEQLIYVGLITAKTIDWCEVDDYERTECVVNTSSEEYTDGVTLLKRLRTSLIQKNNITRDGRRFWDIPHVEVPYCLFFEPSAIQYFIIVIGSFISLTFIIMQPLFFIIGVIVGIINAIISFLGSLFGGEPISLDDVWDSATSGFDQFRSIFTEQLPKWMTGCGDAHYGVLVRSYINNAIFAVDPTVTFESSILNNPSNAYYNLCLLNSPNDEGREDFHDYTNVNGNAYVYFSRNAPNWTLGELLDRLATVFNAEWYLDGTVLRFEKRSSIRRLWLDLSSDDVPPIKSKCFSFEDPPYPVGARLTYQPDGYDTCTDRAKYLFDDTVPFEPAGANQDGFTDIHFQFASMRGRGDNLAPDPLEVFSPLFDVFGFFGLDIVKPEWEDVMLLSSGKIGVPKLVCLENNYDPKQAYVVRFPSSDGKNYNYPMWVDASLPAYNPFGRYDNQPNSIKRSSLFPNLWQFFTDLDPINQAVLVGRGVELEIDKECEIFEGLFNSLGQINFNLSIRIKAGGNYILAQVNEVQVKPTTLVIKAKY